jgi:hypothetical protein
MNDREVNELGEKLRAVMPPVQRAELGSDLWPAMLARLAAPRVRVPWYDWLLAAAAAAVLLFFPSVIPALLYHL